MNTEQKYKLLGLIESGSKVNTDTRKIAKGDIFFALKGPNFNGNNFAAEALKSGAIYSVVDDPSLKNKENMIFVDNTLSSLQDLARAYRKTWNFPVLCITGSNGKTTSKELLSSVLNSIFEVYSTPGNLNNHIGVPLTILNKPSQSNFAILELGANHLKEHAFLCEIARPDYGLITNNGRDHLEGYGSLENVIKSNCELFEYLKNHDGFAFINADDPHLKSYEQELKSLSFSIKNESEYMAEVNKEDLFANINIKNEGFIDSKLVGWVNSYNMISAYAIGSYFKISFEEIKLSIESYSPKLNRSQFLNYNGIDIILDAYNSNPDSLNSAIDNFERAKYDKKLLILGGMLELGEFEKKEHQLIIDRIKNFNSVETWLLGKEFKDFRNENNMRFFESNKELKEEFKKLKFNEGLILIKGSRKYRLEEILDD